MNRPLICLALVTAVLTVPVAASAQESEPAADAPTDSALVSVLGPGGSTIVASQDSGMLLILDTSRSMNQKTDGVRRIKIAKRALRSLINEALGDNANVAIRVFGQREGEACRSELLIHPGPLDREAALTELQLVQPTIGSRTPIAGSILMVADDLEPYSSKVVVLITDGDDTCKGDPAETIAQLQAAGIDFQLHVVGFDIRDKAVKAKMRSWAEVTGGTYVDAADTDQLLAALTLATSAAYTVQSLDDPELAVKGTVGGPPVEVPPGIYAIWIASDIPYEPELITLESGDEYVEQLPG